MFHRVVQYIANQKFVILVPNRYLENPQHITYETKNSKGKVFGRFHCKVSTYLLAVSRTTQTPSLIGLSPKTSNPARINWEGILGESRVVTE